MPASSEKPLRVLILGGSSDATALAQGLADRPNIAATLSLAGRTRDPAPQSLATRVGGFGGATGLAAYLQAEAVDILIDATHPFAEHISTNACAAARTSTTSLIRVERPAWRAVPGDDWREVENMIEAVAALGAKPRRVLLTVGRQRLAAFARAPWHHYLVRTIDPASDSLGLPDVVFTEARPPFDEAAEVRLMRDHRIEVLVTKNSGGDAAYGKIAAARALGLPVVMVRRPAMLAPPVSVEAALDAIDAHAAEAVRSRKPRGV